METYVIAGAVATIVLAQAAVIRLCAQQRHAIDRLDDRIAHLTAGLSLLTDTTEGGLRDVALEVERLASIPAARPGARAAMQRRVAGAAKRGRSVQEIAVTEQMQESEVRLRLHLAEQLPYAKASPGNARSTEGEINGRRSV